MECTKCKLQYVGKAETELNLRMNNHRKDVLKLNVIPAYRQISSYRFFLLNLTSLLNAYRYQKLAK